ncbi:hypothetical protein DFH06DRAFT_1213370 [Mycena polygramma]|nr:hypothetical protein DFH06DRAFT_1213370 [Mycena polygramma]
MICLSPLGARVCPIAPVARAGLASAATVFFDIPATQPFVAPGVTSTVRALLCMRLWLSSLSTPASPAPSRRKSIRVIAVAVRVRLKAIDSDVSQSIPDENRYLPVRLRTGDKLVGYTESGVAAASSLTHSTSVCAQVIHFNSASCARSDVGRKARATSFVSPRPPASKTWAARGAQGGGMRSFIILSI